MTLSSQASRTTTIIARHRPQRIILPSTGNELIGCGIRRKAEAERWVPHEPGPTCRKSRTSLDSALLDSQIMYEPLERLGVGVVLLPGPEVADVAGVPQLARLRLARAEHRVVEPDREQDDLAARDAHRSTSPNTTSSEPMIDGMSARVWPRPMKSIASRWTKLGERILQR